LRPAIGETTGTVVVALLRARAACGPAVTITSGFAATSSAASAGSRSRSPSAYRVSHL
jgi:hypothetical protein